MSESWPSRHEPPPPALPRVEELPIVTEGYDRQKVREAFDAFYRHAAQLDSALRTLEAVDAFQRSAAELRGDLRAIRAAGFAAQTWQRPYTAEPRVRRPLLPEAFPRVAVEVVFLIAVAVALGVSGWGALPVIGVMALALTIVWAVEWLASRERPARPVVRRAAAQPARPAVEAPEPGEAPAAAGWAAYAERDDERADAMTIVEPLPGTEPVAVLEAPEEEEGEVVEVVVDAVVESEPEPDLEAKAQNESDEAVSEAEPIEDEERASAEASDNEPSEIDEPDAEEPVAAQQTDLELDAPAEHEAEPSEVDSSESAAAAAEPEPPLDEEELIDEPVAEAVPGEAGLDDVPVEAEPALAPRASLWQRMRGRGHEPEPVLVEPPRASVTEDIAAPAEDAEESRPLVDEVGVREADASSESPAQLDEVGIVESSEITETPPVAVDEPSQESGDDRPAGRSFWRRRRRPESSAVVDDEFPKPSAPVAEEELQFLESEAAIDPWEQGLELPVEPELEPIEAEQEVYHDDEHEVEREALAEHEPLVLAEDEPLVRAGTEVEDEQVDGDMAEREDEVLVAAAGREDEGSAILAEAVADSDGTDNESGEAAQPKELPIEVLAEQAAAALERSRARRRHLRRARRR